MGRPGRRRTAELVQGLRRRQTTPALAVEMAGERRNRTDRGRISGVRLETEVELSRGFSDGTFWITDRIAIGRSKQTQTADRPLDCVGSFPLHRRSRWQFVSQISAAIERRKAGVRAVGAFWRSLGRSHVVAFGNGPIHMVR